MLPSFQPVIIRGSKRWTQSLFFFALMGFFLFLKTGNGFGAEKTNPLDMQRILLKGSLTVAVYHEDVPPFFMHGKKGDFLGIDIELAKGIAKQLEVKVEFDRSAKTFDALVDLVSTHQVDIAISVLSNTLSRARWIRFTQPYVVLHQSLLLNRLQLAKHVSKQRRKQDFHHLLNRKEATIGVIQGTSYIEFAKADYPLATIKTYLNWDSVIKEVLEGNIFAVLYDEIEIKNWHKDNPSQALYVKTKILKNKEDPIAVGVHKDDVHLLAWLNLYIEKIKRNGVLDALKNTYLESGDWRNL